MGNGSLFVLANEVNDDATFHCEALAAQFPSAETVDFPAGERLDPEVADAVVLTGSTAGVYERDRRPWIDDEISLVRELCEREVPTLGVCFGHQLVNVALGGSVTAGEMTAGLVAAELADHELFAGVHSAVPALHGDRVTAVGDGLDRIASAPHAEIFGTAHPERPLWTVQFHPEFDASTAAALSAYDWSMNGYAWADVTADQVFQNFERLAGLA